MVASHLFKSRFQLKLFPFYQAIFCILYIPQLNYGYKNMNPCMWLYVQPSNITAQLIMFILVTVYTAYISKLLKHYRPEWKTCSGVNCPFNCKFITWLKLVALNPTTDIQGSHGDNTFHTVCREESNVSGLQGVVMGTVRWPTLRLWFSC